MTDLLLAYGSKLRFLLLTQKGQVKTKSLLSVRFTETSINILSDASTLTGQLYLCNWINAFSLNRFAINITKD
tara:strand:+ start:529 stop:747 length:219 start_codon:yes stop_codon:yes gene_type:complete